MPKPTVDRKFRQSPDTAKLMHIHADLRGVSDNTFLDDIVRGVLIGLTDYGHPYFDPKFTGISALDPIPNRKPGYVASLGFTNSHLIDHTPEYTPPPPEYGDHTSQIPETEADNMFSIDQAELERLKRNAP